MRALICDASELATPGSVIAKHERISPASSGRSQRKLGSTPQCIHIRLGTPTFCTAACAACVSVGSAAMRKGGALFGSAMASPPPPRVCANTVLERTVRDHFAACSASPPSSAVTDSLL